MSMIGNLLRVTSSELEDYLKDSSLLESSIYDDESEDANPNLLDLDKAWEGIIFLLTGQGLADADHPLLHVLFSGQIIDEDQDLGYGPANYLTAEQVADLNNQIAGITVSDLKQQYDPKRMTELDIYPSIWEENEDEAFDYLSEYFVYVQQAYSDAARNGQAIITFLN